MSLLPTQLEQLARVRTSLRMGGGVILMDANQSALVLAAETLSVDRLETIRNLSPGNLVLAITARRADTLKARAYDNDVARVAVPQTADIDWVRALADPANDLRFPMKGPYETIREGSADIHRAAIQLAKSAQLLPAVLVQVIQNARQIAMTNHLPIVDVTAIIELLAQSTQIHQVAAARVPISPSFNSQLHVYRPGDGGEEHYAFEIGQPDRSKPVLTRLHSACFTGDVLGSLKCDCGSQLHGALEQMGQAGNGILLYLNQEGRGIGLANKMRAYSLQDQGFDTVQANHRLGFEDDERDFRLGAEILRSLGFSAVNLMTNNPAKVEKLKENGIKVVKRIPLSVGQTSQNKEYLQTKARKSGHLL